jgi:hypothetical protein
MKSILLIQDKLKNKPYYEIIVDGLTSTQGLYHIDDSAYNYDYYVDWGDGSVNHITSWDDPNREHIYSIAQEYIIKVYGIMDSLYTGTGGHTLLIKELNAIGTPSPMKELHIKDIAPLILIPDIDYSHMVTFERMFQGTLLTKTNLTRNGEKQFNVNSSVTNMSSMFVNNRDLETIGLSTNEPIWLGGENVTNISFMFWYCGRNTSNGVYVGERALWNLPTDKYVDVSSLYGHAKLHTWEIYMFKYHKLSNCANLFIEGEIIQKNSQDCLLDADSKENFNSAFSGSTATYGLISLHRGDCTSMFESSAVNQVNSDNTEAYWVTNFTNMYKNCTDITMDVPNYWDDSSLQALPHAGCFEGCVNASNYASIPADWK